MASPQLASMNNASVYIQQRCLIFQAASDVDSLTHFHLKGRRHLPNGVLPHDPGSEFSEFCRPVPAHRNLLVYNLPRGHACFAVRAVRSSAWVVGSGPAKPRQPQDHKALSKALNFLLSHGTVCVYHLAAAYSDHCSSRNCGTWVHGKEGRPRGRLQRLQGTVCSRCCQIRPQLFHVSEAR